MAAEFSPSRPITPPEGGQSPAKSDATAQGFPLVDPRGLGATSTSAGDATPLRPTVVAARSNPHSGEISEPVEPRPDVKQVEVHVEVFSDRRILSQVVPDNEEHQARVDEAVRVIQRGIPSTWETLTTDSQLHVEPHGDRTIIAAPASNTRSARENLLADQRLSAAIADPRVQAMVAENFPGGIDTASVLAVQVNTATDEAVIAYAGRNGEPVTDEDLPPVEDALTKIRKHLRDTSFVEVHWTPDDTLVERGEAGKALHVFPNGPVTPVERPKTDEPAAKATATAQRPAQEPSRRPNTPPELLERITRLLDDNMRPRDIHKMLTEEGVDVTYKTIENRNTKRREEAKARGETLPSFPRTYDRTDAGLTGQQVSGRIEQRRTEISDAIAAIKEERRAEQGDKYTDELPSTVEVSMRTGYPQTTVSRDMREMFGRQLEEHRTPDQITDLINEARQLLAANPRMSVTAAAERLGVSRPYLSTLLNQPQTPEESEEN